MQCASKFLILAIMALLLFNMQIMAVPYTYLSGSNGYPDSTGNELQDGYFPLAYSNNVDQWVGIGPYVHMIPVFNFGQATTLNSLSVFVHSGNAGIGMPAGIAVSFSNDGVNFSNTQTYTTPSSYIADQCFPNSSLTGSLDFTLSGDVSTRTAQYIKVDISNSIYYWIFIGEVSFNTSTTIPEMNTIACLILGSLSIAFARMVKK